MEITIRPLSIENIDDFLYFFDKVAFTDNEEWAGCYCCFYHFDSNNEEWEQNTGETNRAFAIEMIQAGKMKGYLAYADGAPIGWCNVNKKNNFERITNDSKLWDGTKEKVCSIVCFVISHEHRKKGVASQILNTICNDYAKKEYDYVEAYPRKGELSSAMHYHGPLSMYSKSGFTIYKSFDSFDIVRKKL